MWLLFQTALISGKTIETIKKYLTQIKAFMQRTVVCSECEVEIENVQVKTVSVTDV